MFCHQDTKTRMKAFLTVLFLTFNVAVLAEDQPLNTGEANAYKLVAKLPEVIRFNKDMIKSLKRAVVITVDNDATASDPFYTVAVAEDFGDRLFTVWRFCVSAKTNAIYYYHTFEGKKEPLALWRKHGRKW